MGKTLAASYDFSLLAGALRESPGRDRLVPHIRIAETGGSHTHALASRIRMAETGARISARLRQTSRYARPE